ncbi:MAG: hypothetical protein ACJAVV_001667 [Alphaproteobacteria bacterium]|jgi:hypothetical protein
MRLIGILHGILLIGLLGYYIMRMSGGNSQSNKGNQAVFLGIGLVIIGYGGTFFGNAIKASVSRQREYLADASAVQFTRNNLGIANALKKIGGYSFGSKLETTEAQSMSHAFFSNTLSNKFSSLFSTHPSLPKRIKQLEPSWAGTFEHTKAMNNTALDTNAANISQLAKKTSKNGVKDPLNTKTAAELTNSVGKLEQSQIDIASAYLASMPPKLVQAVRTTTGAQAYVYALLLNESTHLSVAERQLEYLLAHLPGSLYLKTSSIRAEVNALPVQYRLPLLEIALPHLRQVPRQRYEAMLQQMQYLVFADKHLSLFEWSIANIVAKYLNTEFETADKKQVKYHTIKSVQTHIESLISVLMIQYEFCQPREYDNILAKSGGILNTKQLSIKVNGQDAIEEFANAISALQYLSFDLKEKVLQLGITLSRKTRSTRHKNMKPSEL